MRSDYEVEVKLIAVTGLTDSTLRKMATGPESERLIEYAGRLCWDTTQKMGSNPSRIQEWIKVGHESVIEHASATFYIRASRAVTHELVRHRIASYSQRSQRYVVESKPNFITPPDLLSDDRAKVFNQAMRHAWKAYGGLLKSGVKPEIARYVLPNACATEIVMTMNFRELRHFIKLRTSKRALPEMQEVAGKVKAIIKEVAPKVFEDI